MDTPHSSPRRSSGPPWSALLDVAGPGGHRTSLPFRPPRVIVGRKRSNDLALPDQGVSSAHCEFVIESGWFVVRDLASINGTFVNDQRISEARLRDGDVVRLGATKITVALHGTLRGAEVWSVASARAHWVWLALGAAIVLAALGALELHRRTLADEVRLRMRYAASVRALLQSDPCSAVAPRVTNLAALDARIANRPVPMAAPGKKLSPAMQQLGGELLGLYRAKAEESAHALQALSEEQSEENDAFEKVGKLAQDLKTPQDRKIAFFAQEQLGERLKRGEALLASFGAFARETRRFADLVEAVSVRGDASRAQELLAFRFTSQGAAEQLASCQTELGRTSAGALGAINGLAEE